MVWLFTLPGPLFLRIYLIACLLSFVGVFWLRAALEPEPENFQQIRDPYVVAYLRGELDELIRVVTLSLALRGLLKVDSKGIQTVDPAEIERAQVPIEKALLAACRQRATPVLIEANAQIQAASAHPAGTTGSQGSSNAIRSSQGQA